MSKRLRLIGDVHSKFDKYAAIVEDANSKGLHTLQIGDFGFADTYDKFIKSKYNNPKNSIMGGNHDCYNILPNIFASIGDYGPFVINGVQFFFVRGGYSIDWWNRIVGIDWFPEEELPLREHNSIIELFKLTRPKLVISHECPHMIGKNTILKNDNILVKWGYRPETFNTNTAALLQKMWGFWKPANWFFGHYHVDWQKTYGKTHFQCIPELGYIDL